MKKFSDITRDNRRHIMEKRSFLLQKYFWSDALERAIKTFCQSALSLLLVGSVDILNLDWQEFLSVTLLAFVISILTSITEYSATPTGVPGIKIGSTGDATSEEEAPGSDGNPS